MRIRQKEIQKAQKRQEDRWKSAHKGTVVSGTGATTSGAPAARAAAAPSRPPRPSGGRSRSEG